MTTPDDEVMDRLGHEQIVARCAASLRRGGARGGPSVTPVTGTVVAWKTYLRQVIDGLVEILTAARLDVWLDRREIGAGDEFKPAICLALVRFSAAVVLFDRDALT